MKRKYYIFIIIIVSFLAGFASFTQHPVTASQNDKNSAFPNNENWSLILYNNNNGMPFSEANDVEQTHDGFIYIGSYGGLVRFDGEDFYQYENDYRLANIVNLYADSRNRLWIATNSNGLARMEHGLFTFYGGEDGLESLNIRCFEEDSEGNILIGTLDGVYYMTPEDELCRLSDPHLDSGNITNFYSDGQGTIYGLTKNQDIFTIENLEITNWYPSGQVLGYPIGCICPDPDNKGAIYIGLQNGDLMYGKPDTPELGFRRIRTPGVNYINCILPVEDRLWIASGRGIGIVDHRQYFFQPDIMQTNYTVESILKDREGNIWLTSDRMGVLKICPSIFCDIYSHAGLDHTVVNSTFVKNDILYIGSDKGLVCLDTEYNKVETPVSSLLNSARIRCIMQDSAGSVWFCTYSENGLVCLKPDGGIRKYTVTDGFASNNVREIYEMRDGTLAVSVVGGVYLLRDGKIEEKFEEEDGLPNPQILTMCEYEDGQLLLGTDGNGVFAIDDHEIKPLAAAEDLKTAVIRRIRWNQETNSWWILTNESSRILQNGAFRKIHKMPTLHIYDVTFDKKGKAWFLAGDGIYTGKVSDILSEKPVLYTHYDYKSGLPFSVTPHCRNFQTEEDVLYMSGNEGPIRISMGQASDDSADVQLTISSVDVDDKTIYLADDHTITLPSCTKKIWVHAYALSYSLNEPVTAYMLEGFDDRMQVANRSDLPSIIYTNLKGGTYTFHFGIYDPVTEGMQNEVSLIIDKKKALHERVSFWVLSVAAVVGLSLLLLKLYLRKKTREMNEEKEKHRIRTELSVAREIQNSMLPGIFPAFPERNEFDIYATMEPAKEVSGDFFDFFLIDADHLAIVIADVSGKGVPAALFMMMSKEILQDNAIPGRSPAEILTRTNQAVCAHNQVEMFITVWLGILDIPTGLLTAANAGHEYPAVKTGSVFSLIKDKHSFVIGGMEGVKYKEYELQLNPGDRLFIYTDGLPEATDSSGEMFGTARMIEALNRNPDGTTREILANVRTAVDEFAGNVEQFDDLTMLCLEYKGVSGDGSR